MIQRLRTLIVQEFNAWRPRLSAKLDDDVVLGIGLRVIRML